MFIHSFSGTYITCPTSIAITAVVSCAVSFITGALVSVVMQNCKFKNFYSIKKTQKQQKEQKQQEQQPVPEYEEVIELKENAAYGPVLQ